MKKGILVVLSGFSGAGKGTVVKELLKRYPNYALSVSATTRNPREGEQDGISYFFKTKEEFEKMIEENAFLEYASYVNNYYGTPKAPVEAQLAAGKDVILEIEMQGALKIREVFPEVLLLFLTPPSIAQLEARLRGRGTESEEVICGRMKQAAEESAVIPEYDYLLVNDTIDECVETVHQTIQMQKGKTVLQKEFIEELRKELFEREGL